MLAPADDTTAFEGSGQALVAPKLAIVIPCYNYEAFVGSAIQSVLSQLRSDCEILVVDDGSTDGSWDAIKRFDVPAVKVENGGALSACLHGVDRTTAPFILFLDADDELMAGALDAIVSRLDQDVAKLQFPLIRIDETGGVISGPIPPLRDFRDRKEIARRVLRTGVYQSPPTSGNVFRRDLCELARTAQSYDRWIDGVMLFAAPFVGDVVSMSEPWARYRVHRANLSGMGRLPDPKSFETNMGIFADRMAHLSQVIGRVGAGRKLMDYRTVYYFRELSFSHAVASGQRPKLIDLPGLLGTLVGEPMSAKNKIALALYFCLASTVSRPRAKALLAYRLSPGHRSLGGFLKELFASPTAQAI